MIWKGGDIEDIEEGLTANNHLALPSHHLGGDYVLICVHTYRGLVSQVGYLWQIFAFIDLVTAGWFGKDRHPKFYVWQLWSIEIRQSQTLDICMAVFWDHARVFKWIHCFHKWWVDRQTRYQICASMYIESAWFAHKGASEGLDFWITDPERDYWSWKVCLEIIY